MYEYNALVTRVIDGDTIDVDIDLGLGVHKLERIRIAGINTPEMRGDEKQAGIAARDFLCGMLDVADSRVSLLTRKDKKGKYGRYLAVVFVIEMNEDETMYKVVDLGQELINAGHAKEYK